MTGPKAQDNACPLDPPETPRSAVPRGSFVLRDEEPPLAPLGHGALANLILHRGLEDEEAVYDGPEEEYNRRDERRMSAILNSSNIRSMRLIGNSNPRYQWERYWKTEEELAKMPKPMFVLTRIPFFHPQCG
jgi:hypothetical protein